jgi:pimeloyl-ACP methyl ester carboxylesterase
MEADFHSHFFVSVDGLELHALTLGDDDGRAPIVCLPGLTRPARDFIVLALHLHRTDKRRIISLDYRRRGGSDWDPDWKHYSLPVEHADLLHVLDEFGVERGIFIGLSRGGLHAVTLGATQPDRVAGLVLNDVGPQLEASGLARIKDYIGRLPLLRNLEEAVTHYKTAMGASFPAVPDEDWRFYANSSLVHTPERMRLSYDPQLARTMESFDPSVPLPDLWPAFESIQAPILALRGENSDLLTEEAHRQMAARNPQCQLHTVKGQGHAPLLLDTPTLNRIGEFIDQIGD